MKLILKIAALMVLGSAVIACSQPTPEVEQPANAIEISDAKVRAAFAQAQTGAAYVTLTNTSSNPVTLSSVSVSSDIAMMVELHDMVMEGDMMKMQKLAAGVMIPANSQVKLAPGAKHIMLMGLKTPLDEGNSVDMTFNFDNGQTESVSAPVVKM